MIDAQHAYSPPLGLEYTIPLPPSPVASLIECASSFDVSEAECSPSEPLPAPTMRVLAGHPRPMPEERPAVPSESDPEQSVVHPDIRSSTSDSKEQDPLSVAISAAAQIPLPETPEPTVSFEQFAIQHRRCQQAEIEKQVLEHRLVSTKVSICLSSRLLRTGVTVQRGLVDAFKHGDKPGFVAIYNTIHDIQESCELGSRRYSHAQQPLPEEPVFSLHPQRTRSASFMHQLSSQSRKDLLEILTLVRTDPQFLVDCITSLLPSQLSALTTPLGFSTYGDNTISSHSTRSRNSATFTKRASSNSIPFKEHAWALERSDPLSALLFNVFAVPLDWHPGESELRLETWSSTCAKLLSSGDSKYTNFVGQVLSYWSTTSDWQARQKIELYLMDVLQKGAFLLENIESPIGAHSLGVEPPDPLRTDAAEEFFDSAVQTLFEVLDDTDGGLPSAVLDLCNAVVNKLGDSETRDRFLEFIFVQWFFSRYLYYVLTFPEGQGLLLDFHISREAREKLLGQIVLRAQSQFYRVLHSVPQFSTVNSKVRRHIDSMIRRCLFSSTSAPDAKPHNLDSPTIAAENSSNTSPRFLMLCATDVVTLLNALFPKSANSPAGSLSSNSPSYAQHSGSRRAALPAHWSGRIETVLERPTHLEPERKASAQRAGYRRCADVIRFELSDLGETDDHPVLDHPSTEDWTVFAISTNSKSLTWDSFSGNFSDRIFDGLSETGHRSGTVHPEEDYEALHTAIQKLANGFENPNQSGGLRASRIRKTNCMSLEERFDTARSVCETRSDFLGAHYWWTASSKLKQSVSKLKKSPQSDSWILSPMLQSSNESFIRCNSVIHNCEESLFTLSPFVEQLRDQSRNSIANMTKLRNKMWYMTDVKNSMRYEDAKHVALALKTMVYPTLHRESPTEYRSRNGSRYLGGGLLQKPEVHVMNVMKASTSQGGPNKLSDEQVEITRKWISHNGIDNFCRGEERIHRFCYEVKSSINKLVGDSMAETPVLWASELFQRERVKYEGPTSRNIPGIPTTPGARPSSTSSEDALSGAPYSSIGFRSTTELPPLLRKSSHQSLSSEKWKYSRNLESDTVSSSGGSFGRATSSSTSESYTTFWSPFQTQAQSAASASSFQSRPPSMFSDAPAPRRTERAVHGKTVFLEELRQTLTGLLLSDLGSPVWSCGSETDAWFINFLNQTRVQRQMDKQARIQKFLAESDSAMHHQRTGRMSSGTSHFSHRRSHSADPVLISIHEPCKPGTESVFGNSLLEQQPAREEQAFSYKSAFSQLLDVFSRNANPYVKLGALRDLRALIVASLDSVDDMSPTPRQHKSIRSQGLAAAETLKSARHSFAEDFLYQEEPLRTPTSPLPESVDFDSYPAYDLLNTSESRIITAIKSILKELQPKTLFRDLQFVSAFVPSETLNKTDSGTAFLQFGLAALSLKEDVCASMVELADKIVSQELNRRHTQAFDFISRAQDPIEDAARMWIITAKEGYPVAQRELAILYLTHPEILPRATLPLTLPRDTFKAEMMYRRDRDSKFDPQSMCLALHWMQLSASGGDELARNRLREREEFESLV